MPKPGTVNNSAQQTSRKRNYSKPTRKESNNNGRNVGHGALVEPNQGTTRKSEQGKPVDELRQVLKGLKIIKLVGNSDFDLLKPLVEEDQLREESEKDNFLRLKGADLKKFEEERKMVTEKENEYSTVNHNCLKPVKQVRKLRTPEFDDFPKNCSLLAPINVPLDITAQEILDRSAKRMQNRAEFLPVFEEKVQVLRPPLPPKPEKKVLMDKSELMPPTPMIIIKSRKDADSWNLRKFCENAPITLVRGLTSVLDMDLTIFLTGTLLEKAEFEEVEIRKQYRMISDVNVDDLGHPTWECHSFPSQAHISYYSKYQRRSFKKALAKEAEKLRQTDSKYVQQTAETQGAKRRKVENKDDKVRNYIKLATNFDLSDGVKWKDQLQELSKLPDFCRITSNGNMLSHLGYEVEGMNTAQISLNVPGAKTPAHQENNNLSYVSLNVGPGDCEWYCVPYEYWGVVEKLCRKHNIDFLEGSYWPNLKELHAENVPVHRFIQKAGDLVFVGGGSVYWVKAIGWCNCLSWSVGSANVTQLVKAIRSYEYNKQKECKSLVPLEHLAWQLARRVNFTTDNRLFYWEGQKALYTLVRSILIRSLSFHKIAEDYVLAKGITPTLRSRSGGDGDRYCANCSTYLFNILLAYEVEEGKRMALCVYCAREYPLDKMIAFQQYTQNQLIEWFDGMVLQTRPSDASTS